VFAFASLGLLAACAVVLLIVPRRLVAGYRVSFAARHGIAFQVGATVLATLVVSTLVLTLMRPGEAPLMERVDAAVTLMATLFAAWDLRAYAVACRESGGDGGESGR
jgi:hypothetical protein